MDFQLQNSAVSLLGSNNTNNNGNTTTSYEPLLNEKKYFDDKQSIKPWLHSKLIMKGINIVIERSDDTKIVFKCKNNHNNHQHNTGSKIKTNNKSLVKEVTRRNKTSCPFRIRANYSLRAKKWSIVIVNDQHNHSIYPSNNINEALSSSANEANKLLKKPVLEASNSKRLNFGPTNSLLMAAQTVNNQQPSQQQMQSPTPPQQQQQISKFQLPLPSNFNQQVHQLTNDSISSRSSSSSSSSSPNPLYSDNSTILSNSSNNNKQPIYTAQQSNQQSIQLQQMQQQKLNLLHIDINNLLLHLNTSSNISDSNKEETYNKIIYSLKDILNPSNHVTSNNRIITSPTSSSNSPNNNLSLNSNYSYNYKASNNNATPSSMNTSTSEKIMLPSLTNSLQGSLQSIRSSPSSSASQQQQPQQAQQQQSSIGINVNSSINNTSSILGNGHHSGGSNNFQQFYL